MRAVVQRVRDARVDVDGRTTGAIDFGLLVYMGVGKADGIDQVNYLVKKLSTLRIFEDDEGKMNLDLRDVGGSFLVVSQFTLWADTRKGRRPSYNAAAPPSHAIPLYEAFVSALRDRGFAVGTGEFGAMMQVHYTNDGPVTIILDTDG